MTFLTDFGNRRNFLYLERLLVVTCDVKRKRNNLMNHGDEL